MMNNVSTITPLGKLALWHQAQADTIRSFSTMLGSPLPDVDRANIEFHERAAVTCREADTDEPQDER